jgi:hypothetical protein
MRGLHTVNVIAGSSKFGAPDGGGDREKALCRSRRLEALHTSFALSQWLMGILCPVTLPATGDLRQAHQQGTKA